MSQSATSSTSNSHRVTSVARLQLERIQRAVSRGPAQLEKLIGHVLGIAELTELAHTNSADVRALGTYTIHIAVSIVEAIAAAPQSAIVAAQLRPIQDVIDEIATLIDENTRENASVIERARIRIRAEQVEGRFKELRQKLDDAVRAYELTSGLQLHIDMERMLHTTERVQTRVQNLQKALQGVSAGVENLHTGVQGVHMAIYGLRNGVDNVQAGVQSLQEIAQRLEQRLEIGDEAALRTHFPSVVSSWSPDDVCLDNTRVDVIHSITTWAWDRSPDKPTVCWLEGMAGCGKTTIAHSVAQALSPNGWNGTVVTFFFKRGVAGCDDPHVVLSTLARDVSQVGMPLRREIMAALRTKDTLCGESSPVQLSELLLKPIHTLMDSGLTPSPVTVIWEGVDECGTRESLGQLLEYWATNLKHLSRVLQFCVTSRPDANISRIMKSSSFKVHKLVLDPFTPDTVEDIRRYFDRHLNIIANHNHLASHWPTQGERDQLVTRADKLFIWAATARRFIAESNPKKALRLLLQPGAHGHAETPIDKLYMLILENAVPPMSRHDFRVVLGTIVVLFDRITASVLVQLVRGLLDPGNDSNADSEDVTAILQSLRPVLKIDGAKTLSRFCTNRLPIS